MVDELNCIKSIQKIRLELAAGHTPNFCDNF